MSDRTKVGLLIVLVKLWLLLAELTGGVYAQGWFQQAPQGPCPGGQCPQIQPQFLPQFQRRAPQQLQFDEPPPQVVRIGNTYNGQPYLGSGTLIEGGILTCAHLFLDEQGNRIIGSIAVKFPGQEPIDATLIDLDDADDLALLSVETNVQPSSVASEAPRAGEPVFSSGYGPSPPRQYLVNRGRAMRYVRLGDVIKGHNFQQDGFLALDISGASRQGDSGGPMFNSRGEIVGVISGTGEGVTTGTCCIGIRRFLERVRARIRGRGIEQQQPPAMPGPNDDEGPRDDAKLAELQQQLAESQAALEAARNAKHECGDNCQCKAGELAKLQAELQAANSKPPKIVEVEKPVEVPGKPKIVTRVKEKIVHVAGNWLGTLATGALVGAGVSTPLAGFAVWLGRRRLKKRLKQWEGGDLSSAAVTPSSELQRERDGLLARLRSEREEVARLKAELAARPTIERERIIREPAAPPTIAIDERHRNFFSTIPDNLEGRAWARATQIYLDKFPGAERTLKAVSRLKDQIIAGEPADTNTL